MNPLKRKALITSGVVVATSSAAVAGIAVSIDHALKNKVKYDFGLLTSPVNSLNYIKYGSSRNVVGATIPTLTHKRAKDDTDIAGLLTKKPVSFGVTALVPKFNFTTFATTYEKQTQIESGITQFTNTFDSYYLKNYKVDGNTSMNINMSVNNDSQVQGYSLFLDKTVRWNDGSSISASEFINYINMILDLNNSSLLIPEVQDFGISGVTRFIKAQKAYFDKHGEIYKHPLGVNKATKGHPTRLEWPSNATTLNEVKEIEDAYKAIGMYGDEYSSRPYSIAPANSIDSILTKGAYDPALKTGTTEPTNKAIVDDFKSKYKNEFKIKDNESEPLLNDAFLLIKYKNAKSLPDVSNQFSNNAILMPIHGLNPQAENFDYNSVVKYGVKIKDMPYIGAYKFLDGALGNNGYLSYEKNKNFIYKSDVFANKIKLYFSTNPNVNYAMYKDGFIASTSIPSIQISKVFADLEERKNLGKSSSASTEGLSFNLDPWTREKHYGLTKKNDPLQYASFRKAVFYSVDREQLLKVMQQDSSLPMSNYSSTITRLDQVGNWASNLIGFEETSPITQQYAGTTGSGNTHPLNSLYGTELTNNKYIDPIKPGEDKVLIKQFSSLSRYSIDYKFEATNRKDLVTNVSLAKKFFAKFKQEWKENNKRDFTHYDIKYIYGNAKLGEDLGVSLANQLKNTFGSEVSLDIQGYSNQIFNDYKARGEFDIIYGEIAGIKTLSDASKPGVYIQKLLTHDYVKNGGSYYYNPTGGWTFDEILEKVKNDSAYKADLINRLHIHPEDMNTILNLVEKTDYEKELAKTDLLESDKYRADRISAWINNIPFTEGGKKVDETSWTNQGDRVSNPNGNLQGINKTYLVPAKRHNVLAQFDKFVLEESPVIPITIGGQSWNLSRLYSSTTRGGVFQFEYSFDKNNPPLDMLKKLL